MEAFRKLILIFLLLLAPLQASTQENYDVTRFIAEVSARTIDKLSVIQFFIRISLTRFLQLAQHPAEISFLPSAVF